jgi:membrane fusion protein, multidrug efflux system
MEPPAQDKRCRRQDEWKADETRMRKVIWAGALLLALGTGGAFIDGIGVAAHAQQSGAPAEGRPQGGGVPVRVATAAIEAMPVQIDTIGNVQTVASVSVKSRIDAVIDQVLVKDGQFVKAGDTLFQLDSRAAQAQLHQFEATLARDQVQLANSQRQVERDRTLIAKDFVSHQQFDNDSANAAALEATVRADQAQVENAKVLLSYYTIVSPLDGRVGVIAIKRGNSIKANDVPLATVNQIQPIYVSFALPQSGLPELRSALAAGPVVVNVLAHGDKGTPVTGKVAFFDNAIDTTSGTINVRATFDNAEQRLWPGQFVNVSVVVRTDPNALVIPPAAVQIGQNGSYVFVIKDDNTAEIRPVTVDRTVNGRAIISKGLSAGEKVATDGQLRLAAGTRVQIVTDSPKADRAS